MDYTLWLADVSPENSERVGGKARNLAELIRAGAKVPRGYVVTTSAYREFIRRNDLDKDLRRLLANISYDDAESIQSVSSSIEELFNESPMPPEVVKGVTALCRDLANDGVTHFAVRSSAVAEDLSAASFAGIQETYLFVPGDEVLDSLRRCWASLFTPRALTYRRAKGFSHEDVEIAAIVQSMVSPEKSGVIFTAHPVTGDRGQAVIESTWGLGEAIVSGTVTPDHYVVSKGSGQVLQRIISVKKVRYAYDFERRRGTVVQDLPLSMAKAASLSDPEIRELMNTALKIEQHFGYPQDIEWAISSGEIYILQSRPITTI